MNFKKEDNYDVVNIIFKDNFNKNLIETVNTYDAERITNRIWDRGEAMINYYDINNTAVLVESKGRLKFTTVEGLTNFANLRITGLENNIKMTEEEIKLKGFTLEQLK